MSTYDDLKNYFEEISSHYNEVAADGKIDFSDAVFLAGKAAASFVQVVERLSVLDYSVQVYTQSLITTLLIIYTIQKLES